jgi:hypothetical protein
MSPFALPSTTVSTNSTPVLSALSSVTPLPLMLIGENDFLFTTATCIFTIIDDGQLILQVDIILNIINNEQRTLADINLIIINVIVANISRHLK